MPLLDQRDLVAAVAQPRVVHGPAAREDAPRQHRLVVDADLLPPQGHEPRIGRRAPARAHGWAETTAQVTKSTSSAETTA